jgi:hypothetical protein
VEGGEGERWREEWGERISCINTIVSITLRWVWAGFCETHQCDSVH